METDYDYNRREYENGWRYAARKPYPVAGDDVRAPEWFDGFFDRSAGRPKWYIPTNLDEYIASQKYLGDNERFIRAAA